MNKPTFEYGGMKFRPATPADRDLAAAWVAADPFHAGLIPAEFWYDQAKLTDCFVVEDAEGAVMFVRLDRAVRASVQFAPESADPKRGRTRTALQTAMDAFEVMLAFSGTREMLFDSQSPTLRAYSQRTLKFTPKRDTMSRALRSPRSTAESVSEAPRGAEKDDSLPTS